MSNLKHSLRRVLPHRRRRFWRYVSPHRRGAGVLILAILLMLVYGYWYMTNDRRIRHQAEDYLSGLTGGVVRIHHAEFSIFGGIELTGVRVRIAGEERVQPFFRADSVMLRHRPWALMVGRLEPTEIVCMNPTVVAEYDPQTERWNFQELLDAAARRDTDFGPPPGGLPTIRVPQGKVYVSNARTSAQPIEPTELTLMMIPTGSETYRLTVEEQRDEGPRDVGGSLEFNVVTGEMGRFSGLASFRKLREFLPPKYDEWLKRYGVEGNFGVTRETTDDGSLLHDVELSGFSLQLPAEQGGLRIEDVRGTLHFSAEGVSFENITGRVPAAGDARLSLSGQYGGYQLDSPLTVELDVQGMTVPKAQTATGRLREILAKIHDMYRPSGRADAKLRAQREAGGELVVTGNVWPREMTAVFQKFPYAIEQLEGVVTIEPDRVVLEELTARHGDTRITIAGTMDQFHGRKAYDVGIKAWDVKLDAEFRETLPEQYGEFYDAVDPRGSVGAEVAIRRQVSDDRPHVDVSILLDGKASISYRKFPYRLGNLHGQASISGRDVRLDRIRGGSGEMRAVISGGIVALGTDAIEADVHVTAEHVPLDEKLINALPDQGRTAMKALNPTGRADRLDARVWKPAGESLRYKVDATFTKVGMTPEAFPYPVVDAAGSVTVTPGLVEIERVRGVHGPTPVSADGRVYFSKDDYGLKLHLGAERMRFNEELYAALPTRVRQVWRQLSPSGVGDVSLLIRRNTPELPEQMDYRLAIDADRMAITYTGFPYTFTGVSGRVVAVPGKVELEQMRFSAGRASGTLDGTVSLEESDDLATLAIRAKNIPIDEKLLSAVPESLDAFARRLKPGGSCDLDLKALRLRRTQPDAADEADASTVALAPSPLTTTGVSATRPASQFDWPEEFDWSVSGAIAVKDAVMDIGLGYKTISGQVSGAVERTAEGLALKADVALDNVTVGKRKLTDLQGRLVKTPTAPRVIVTGLSARAYEGRMAGRAEIELAEPSRFAIRLSIQGVQVDDLVNAGVEDPDERLKVKGLLDGNLKLTATLNKPETRQAAGVLRISKAKLYKLPVLLELLNVIYLSLPGDSAFTDAYVDYHLRGDELIFREIYLDGPTLSLVGSGTMNMKTRKMKLTFLSGPPGKLPRLEGLVGELAEGVVRELAEIRITGTPSKPVMRTVSLPSLEETLRRLVNPGKDED